MEPLNSCEKNAIGQFDKDRILNFLACSAKISTKGVGDIDIRCFSKLMEISRGLFTERMSFCKSIPI